MLRTPIAIRWSTLTIAIASLQVACSVKHRDWGDEDAGVDNGTSTGGTSNAQTAVGGSGLASTGGSSSVSALGGSANTTAGGSSSTVAPTTGGISAVGGAPSAGGVTQSGVTIVSGGGLMSAGGITSIGSVTTTGGAIATGGATPASTATAGGAVATGGAATGGVPATGGAVTGGTATGGANACSTNVQSDPLNCGSCGHDCLGGACVSGQCTPATVMAAENADGDPRLIGLDAQNLYYRQSAVAYGSDAYIISKTATNGTGTSVITNQPGAVFYTPIEGQFVWSAEPTRAPIAFYACNPSNCANPITLNVGTPIASSSLLPSYWSSVTECGSVACVQWWDSTWTSVKSSGIADDTRYVQSIMAAGNFVYLIRQTIDTNNNFVSASLFSVNYLTLSLAQLAGSITQHTTIIDASAQSVLLYDSSAGSILRVPLPLGLGNNAPAFLTTAATTPATATEDSSAVYILDGSGTLSKCSPSNCAATAQVLANGQNSPSKLFKDSKALYWSHSNPSAIERLAK